MLLSRKLKIFYILTFTGMVLMTVSFVSPGWVNCKLSNIKSLMVYSEQFGYPKEAHLSAGLWYFNLCIQRLSWTGLLKREECHSAAQPFNIEAPFSNEVLDPTYNKVRGLPKNILLEIQIMSSIGVFCAVLGFMGTIVYTRTLTKSRWAGLLACISLSISGTTSYACVAICFDAPKEKKRITITKVDIFARPLTMLLNRKLKIFPILTFVGVVLMTVSFVSPGWVNCKFKLIFGEPYIQLIDPSVYLDGYPTEAHLSAGLWYFSLCIQISSFFGSMKEERCHLSTYPFNFERMFSHLVLDPSYYQVRGLTRNIMLEIQIMSSIGIFCAVLGFIGTIVYTRTLTKSRCAGLLACISLSISGGTYIATIVKTAIATHVYEDSIRHYTGRYEDAVRLYCPWGLVLGGVGCFLILVSALGHLCILSKNRTDDIHVYHIHKGTNQGTVSQHSYTTIAPPGYHATVGLKVPLVGNMEKNEEASFASYK